MLHKQLARHTEGNMTRSRKLTVLLCWGFLILFSTGVFLFSRQHGRKRVRFRQSGVPMEFVAQEDDKHFLYGQLLSKEHSFNPTNIQSFRKTFHDSNGQPFRDLIVDQSNTNVGSKLHFYIRPGKNSYYEVTEEFHKQLPKKVDMSNLGTCAVVGNSGILNNGLCGEEIDKSDFVFRCNAAPITPYIKRAGSKTNLTSFNPSIFGRRYDNIKDPLTLNRFTADMQQYNGFLLASCFGAFGYIDVCMKALNNYVSERNTFVTAHPDYFTNITDVWSGFDITSRLSSGLYLTTAAILSCGEVHLYGFWPFPLSPGCERSPVPYHYYDDIKFPKEFHFVTHDMDREFSTLVRLHAHGVIRLHIDGCP